jgi:hypothetical protein
MNELNVDIVAVMAVSMVVLTMTVGIVFAWVQRSRKS